MDAVPQGFDYTKSLLPASDASIIPMKGGGSEAADFYTKFMEVLNLDSYNITSKFNEVIVTSRIYTEIYVATAEEKAAKAKAAVAAAALINEPLAITTAAEAAAVATNEAMKARERLNNTLSRAKGGYVLGQRRKN